jgi:hypothetical protein
MCASRGKPAGAAGGRCATAKTDSASACACRSRSCPPGVVFAPVSRDLGGFLRGRPMDYSGGAGASSTARQLAVVGCLPRVGLRRPGPKLVLVDRSMPIRLAGLMIRADVRQRGVACSSPIESPGRIGSVGVGTGMRVESASPKAHARFVYCRSIGSYRGSEVREGGCPKHVRVLRRCYGPSRRGGLSLELFTLRISLPDRVSIECVYRVRVDRTGIIQSVYAPDGHGIGHPTQQWI